MCDVPSRTVALLLFCSESIENFPGLASKFFIKPYVTVPVVPVITGIILHVCCIIVVISLFLLLFIIIGHLTVDPAH